jgi:inositol-pentakisphosphate 2-kinase
VLRRACQTARVLRLPKAVAAQGTDAKHAALERELWQHVPGFVSAAHEAERNWAFVAHVLAPLLGGERYAAAGTLLAVTSAFLSGLARCASCQGTRIGETGTFAVGMDGSAIGVLLPDHTVFGAPTADSRLVAAGAAPVLSVEIKPKCGFLPQTPAVHECAKRHLSRFVMMQHLKAARGQVGAVRSAGDRAPHSRIV